MNAGIADYFDLYRKSSQGSAAAAASSAVRPFKIAFVSSFTARGFREVLHVKCLQAGIAAEVYVGEYNQQVQEIVDPASGLNRFDPDLTILFLDLRTLAGELYFSPYDVDDQARAAWAEQQLADLKGLVDALSRNTKGRILVHNLEVPVRTVLGILEGKQAFGLVEAVRTLNQRLAELYKQDPRIFVLDYDGFCSAVGKDRILDHKMYYLGDMRLDLRHIPELCDAYLSLIKPMKGLTKKCIVLDLDNTLWGGVLGEDGLGGIRLGPTAEGRSFIEFQKNLLALHRRGVLLAVNSRNNLAEVQKALREHPHMILKEEHFSALRVNWEDKAENLVLIARELNIGLDSLVFFDDDRINRETVKRALPEVRVVDVPEDVSLYADCLLKLNDFGVLQVTQEDLLKGRHYADEKQRTLLKSEIGSIEDYLKELKIKVSIDPAGPLNIPRIAQLTQKTNQFNMTTRRYSEDEIQKFVSQDAVVRAVGASDRFGDSGIVGVWIAVPEGDAWRIDTFLLSCRVLGRKVEHAMLADLIRSARAAGAKRLHAEFIPTAKNEPAKDFFKNNGFTRLGDEKDAEQWEYAVAARSFAAPEHITVGGGSANGAA